MFNTAKKLCRHTLITMAIEKYINLRLFASINGLYIEPSGIIKKNNKIDVDINPSFCDIKK